MPCKSSYTLKYSVSVGMVGNCSTVNGSLREAQEVASALIAAEQRIGEILLRIPKQAGAVNSSRDVEKMKTKSETTSEMGYSKDQVSDYQRMAQNPAIVNLVLEQADLFF